MGRHLWKPERPDVLIVDLTALTGQILRSTNKTELDQAQKSIAGKLLYGGTIVAITPPEFSTLSSRPLAGRPDSPFGGKPLDPYIYSNYHILPINIVTTTVRDSHVIRAGDGHCFKGYIDAVKGYNFVIGSVTDKIPPIQPARPPPRCADCMSGTLRTIQGAPWGLCWKWRNPIAAAARGGLPARAAWCCYRPRPSRSARRSEEYCPSTRLRPPPGERLGPI